MEHIRLVLASEFQKAGHYVEFVLLQKHGELLDEATKYFDVVSLNCSRLRHAPKALTQYLLTNHPDVLLVAMWPLTGIANLAILLSGRTTRLIVSEHNDFRKMPSISRFERWVLNYFGRWIYLQSTAIIAVSQGVSKSLQEVVGLSDEQIVVINNPLRPLPSPSSKDSYDLTLSDWQKGELRLIAIGSLKPQKDFETLLKMVASLRIDYDVRLVILGEGDLRGDLERLATELGLKNRVYLPGFRSDLLTWFRYANVYVLSSRWEGFGNVLVEALSAGVPIVSTNCPSGPAEILDYGKYGKLVEVGDINSMKKAVEEVYLDPPEPHVLKTRAKNFLPSLAAQKYLDIFKQERTSQWKK